MRVFYVENECFVSGGDSGAGVGRGAGTAENLVGETEIGEDCPISWVCGVDGERLPLHDLDGIGGPLEGFGDFVHDGGELLVVGGSNYLHGVGVGVECDAQGGRSICGK